MFFFENAETQSLGSAGRTIAVTNPAVSATLKTAGRRKRNRRRTGGAA
jgi:hypothetical protein